MQVPVYLVVKDSGQRDSNGAEYTIVIEAKLTRFSADIVASKHPGSRVLKVYADKTLPD